MEDCLVARVLPNPSNRELFIRNALLRTHLQTTPPQALDLMASRAVEGGLTNVTTHCGSVAGYHHQVGLVLALHACGQASDEAMMQVSHRATRTTEYVISSPRRLSASLVHLEFWSL